MNSPAAAFLPVLLLFLIAAVVAAIVLVLSGVILPRIKPNNPQASKLTPYECGVAPLQEGARHRYSVKFYLTAMLFILFDVEAAFLYPWAVGYKKMLAAHEFWIFWAAMSFIGTLLIGYVYVWGKGALDWEK